MAGRVEVDLVFATGGQTFRVISEPVDVGSGRYLATVAVVDGPGAGGQLTAQLQVGRRVS